MTVTRTMIALWAAVAASGCGGTGGAQDTGDLGPDTRDALPVDRAEAAVGEAFDASAQDFPILYDPGYTDPWQHDPGLATDAGQQDDIDPGQQQDDATPDVPADAECGKLEPGLVQGFVVDGQARSFYLTVPDGVDENGPWPVIFNWHGFGDTAANMNNLLSAYVDYESFSFILVTPEDTGQLLDWDMLQVTSPNQEARLFDEILECIDARWGVDPDHVHSVGFSAGAVMTDLLAVLRGDSLASVVTYSGGYFSNPDNVSGDIAGFVSWPPLETENGYAQVILHGGKNDSWSAGGFLTIHFDQLAKADLRYLTERGHAVIICDHGKGHWVPQDPSPYDVLDFFAAHPRGSGSPWVASGLPPGWPDYCVIHAAD